MRIIGGKYKGQRLQTPKNLPVRPTSDMAKEALFNILSNRLEFSELDCLDLFAGTGNVSFEFLSRGARSMTAYDIHSACVRFIKETGQKMQLTNLETAKVDVFRFLNSDQKHKSYDLIFADPPYDIPQLAQLPELIFKHSLLKEGGLLILEHPSLLILPDSPYIQETRKYGGTSFSFYSDI